MPASKLALRVGICSDVSGLRGAVERAFAASPLASRHELIFDDVAGGPGDAQELEILLADPGKVAPVLDSVRGLRWLQSTWAGVNALSEHGRRGYTCTRLAGCFGPQMSEYVFGAIFADDWHRLRSCQARGEWTPEPFKKRPRLNAMTLGCLGVGDIASVIAQRGQAFGMQTIGFASRVREVVGFHDVTTDLASVLRKADVVVSVLPSTAETRGLLDAGALAACGAGKLLINVGRGDVVSERSLLEALSGGWLRGAVLDVFADEPLPATSALWGHPAVHVTPHISAVTHPDDTAKIFVDNLVLWLEGQPLKYEVKLDRGY